MRFTLLATFLFSMFPAFYLSAENWPEYRGVDGSGLSTAQDLPVTFAEGQNIRWKTAIHGKGWSSPVIWGKQIWLTTATEDGHQLFAVCVDVSSGKIIHNIQVFQTENPRFCHPTNSYASPTPAIEEGRVYVHFGSYGTACLDSASGKIVWARKDLPCNHWRGPGSSPVIDKDRLLVAYDGFDLQYVVALDKTNGKTLWKQDRNIDYGTDNGDRKKAYSTAAIVEAGGRRQLISPSAVETISYDPASGKELWRVRHGGMNAAIRPLFGNGLLYIAAGAGPNSMIAVRPDGSGDITGTHIQWSLGKGVPKRPSPILNGKRIYMVDDVGIATCLNAENAAVVWQSRIGGSYRSSPILADGRLYCFSLEGDAHVLATGDEFKLLASNKLENGCQASPAAVGKTLYVRSTGHLYAIGK